MSDPTFTQFIKHIVWADPGYEGFLGRCREVKWQRRAKYASTDDPFKNLRSVEALGISTYQGILVRMMDKMARLANAAKNGEPQDESEEDGLIDLVNYAVFAAQVRWPSKYGSRKE